MPLQATSGAASYDAFGGGVAAVPNYIEDVFSTWLYNGTGASQTITNGIDLSGKGGLVFTKQRDSTGNPLWIDTVRGGNKRLFSNVTNGESTSTINIISAFNANGFTVAGDGVANNASGSTYASWAFREQPKFFDVVTYTGTGSQLSINHNLGSVPGCIIVKRTDAASSYWGVYHRSLTDGFAVGLNTTEAAFSAPPFFVNSASQTSTQFTVGTSANVNASGATYVAYLFAHNAGGFGLSGSDNVISCGSFTATSNSATVNLGYEPQWLLCKNSNSAEDWFIYDTMRGWSFSAANRLVPNTSAAEVNDGTSSSVYFVPTATGFEIKNYVNNNTYIYIAIRRGPMKVPTTGMSVFAPATSTDVKPVQTTNFPVDLGLGWSLPSGGGQSALLLDRLRGGGAWLETSSTSAEASTTDSNFVSYFDSNTSWAFRLYGVATRKLLYGFRRAPGFFDEVCYTGTGSAMTVAHNLGVVPEMMIVKCRSNGSTRWCVYQTSIGNDLIFLDSDRTVESGDAAWNNQVPTSSVFYLGTYGSVNTASRTFVNYLFATCPGVSKVGNYTGTGTTQVINCGFTAGARFVLIKRTNGTNPTGGWYVWDSARGIVAGNDPYLLLNSTDAEVTSTDYIDTAATGFEISSTAPAAINASGGSYIFLAIA